MIFENKPQNEPNLCKKHETENFESSDLQNLNQIVHKYRYPDDVDPVPVIEPELSSIGKE